MTDESAEKPLFSPTFVSSPDAGNQDFKQLETASSKPEEGLDQAIRRRATFASEPSTSGRRPTQERAGTGQSRGSRRTLSLRSMLTPSRRVGKAPSVAQSLKSFFFSSWLNVLLVCIPISWALHWGLPKSNENRDVAIFTVSFFAIIPLAKLLGVATDELSMRVGQTLAGLINATLGNAVELIVAIIALTHCELQVVQSSLVGSILSNLLLVLGMCFFAGGLKYSEQGFGHSASQVNSSLLTVSVIAVLLPAAFDLRFNKNSTADDAQETHDILAVSHGVAILLLIMYAGFLFFQLYSHANLYEDSAIIESVKYAPKPKKSKKKKEGDLEKDANGTAEAPGSPTLHDGESDATSKREEEEDEEEPTMNFPTLVVMLVFVTVIIAFTAEWLVDSIDGLVKKGGISKEFVGLILLPIVGNAAEHVTAVTVSVKDKLTLSIGVAVGSSIQIALFVIPFIVTLAWIIGKPLTLLFDPYESITLFLAVLTVNYTVQDGKSNWLEGMILLILYVILAVTFWFYPGTSLDTLPTGLQCPPH